MSIQATCDACGKTYSLNEKYIGKRLPCKECGEVFEVHDEDDFDAASARPLRGSSPKRSAAPARSGKKKPGKKRRKSGPNWLLIGLGGGGGLLVVGGLIWFLMSMLGTSHESLAKASLKDMEAMVSILEDVKDTSSAEAAVSRLQKLGDRIAEHYRDEQRLEETDPMTDEQEKALREKYAEPKEKLQDRLNAELKRLRDIPGVLAIVQEPISDISRKMADVRREERDRKLEERGIDPEKARKDLETRMNENLPKAREQSQQGPVGTPIEAPTMRPQIDPRTGQAAVPRGMLGVVVKMPSVINFDDISDRLEEMSGKTQVFTSFSTAQEHTVTIAPMPDLDRFAKAVDFGKVTEVNRDSRIVTIEPDENYTFKPGGPVAVDVPPTGN